MISQSRAFFRRIITEFSWQFAVVIISIYALLKGAASQVVTSAGLPYFKALNVSGDMYQSFLIVGNVPWSMKAAMGTLSDVVPIFGYHKTSYIILVSILGTAAYAVLGFVQFSQHTAYIAAFFLFLTQFQMAFVDILTEAKYAQMMGENPASGTDLMSFAWGIKSAGMFIGSLIGGPMADHFNPRYIFLVCLPLAAQVLVPPAFGWFPDPHIPAGQRGIRRDKLREHPDLFKLAIAMTVCSIAVGIAALRASGKIQSAVSIIMAVTLCVLGYRWLPPTIRRANLYMFVTSMLYISVTGATDYWFTANEKCVPGGPKFSYTFYNTYAALVGSAAGGLGVVLFQRFLSHGSFRVAFLTTSLIKVLGSVSDIAIVRRWNLQVGIPDWVAFMLGDAVIQQVALMLDLMPAIVLTSKVCPREMEASVFALLVSYQNIGTAASRALGVGLIDFMGIRTTLPCDFDALPMVILVAHIAFPLLTVPLVFWLIPDMNMRSEFDYRGEEGGEAFESVARDEEDGKLEIDSKDAEGGGDGEGGKRGESGGEVKTLVEDETEWRDEEDEKGLIGEEKPSASQKA